MSTLIFGAICAAGGLLAGWVLLPEPKFIRDFWAARGWTDRD